MFLVLKEREREREEQTICKKNKKLYYTSPTTKKTNLLIFLKKSKKIKDRGSSSPPRRRARFCPLVLRPASPCRKCRAMAERGGRASSRRRSRRDLGGRSLPDFFYVFRIKRDRKARGRKRVRESVTFLVPPFISRPRRTKEKRGEGEGKEGGKNLSYLEQENNPPFAQLLRRLGQSSTKRMIRPRQSVHASQRVPPVRVVASGDDQQIGTEARESREDDLLESARKGGVSRRGR